MKSLSKLNQVDLPLFMDATLLTLIGPDRTGIVASLAKIVGDHSGNWLDSRMMRLGGSFSGMVLVSLDNTQKDAFESDVDAFMQTQGYQYSVQPAGQPDIPEGAIAELELSGQDHPGIVFGIFDSFKAAGVNVEELSTGLNSAPWSGTPIFEAKAKLRVPDSVTLETIQGKLEALAADLLVEIQFG